MPVRLMRTRFRDPATEENFERDGYVVIKNMVGKEAIKEMMDIFSAHYQEPKEKVVAWNTAVMVGEEEKNHISSELIKILEPSLNAHLEDFKPPFAYFLTKPAEKTATNIPIHRDASGVDEKQSEYLIFWMPLIDLERDNGCLYILPGSNKLFSYELPFSMDWPYHHLDSVLNSYKIDLKLNAGDAVIFSGKTLHGSYPNTTASPRPVVCSGLIDQTSELLYYYLNRDSNKIEAYGVDPDFFLKSDFSDPNGKYPLRFSFDYQPPAVHSRDVTDFYKKNWGLYKENFGFWTKIKTKYLQN